MVVLPENVWRGLPLFFSSSAALLFLVNLAFFVPPLYAQIAPRCVSWRWPAWRMLCLPTPAAWAPAGGP